MRCVLPLLALLLCQPLFASGFLVPSNPPPVIELAWDQSTDPSVVSYNLYWGVGSRQYTNSLNTIFTNASVTLTFGTTYYFAATCVASNGLESAFSTEISYTTPSIPAAPSLLAPIILVVQSRPATQSFWQDAGMFWSLTPRAGNSLFRLKLVRQ